MGTVEQELETREQATTLEDIHLGDTREGTIVAKTPGGWLVDVQLRCEGFLSKSEWTQQFLIDSAPQPRIGDTIQAMIIRIHRGGEGQVVLSRWRYESARRWAALKETLSQNHNTVQVKGIRKVKGGIIVNCCGLEGFIPTSHLPGNAEYIGQEFEVAPLEMDRRKHRLLLSRKEQINQESARKKATFYEGLHEGDICEGEIGNITKYGIFVSLGSGVHGLVHQSEISWKRNAHTEELYKQGDKVKVKILDIDKEEERISLSIRQVEDDPWKAIGRRLHVNDVVKGTVAGFAKYGVFVELEAGVNGLIHLVNLSWERVGKPSDILQEGQEVEVLVLGIEASERRISLGYKQLIAHQKSADKAAGDDATEGVKKQELQAKESDHDTDLSFKPFAEAFKEASKEASKPTDGAIEETNEEASTEPPAASVAEESSVD